MSGTPVAGSSGTYALTLTATTGHDEATQAFTLAVVTASTAVLIVHDGTAGMEANVVANLTANATAAGLTPTANVGVPAGSQSDYAQIRGVRFDNTTLLAGDITSYTSYVAGGRTLVVIGENMGFATRDDSIVSLIGTLGGGAITLTTPENAQTVQPPFTTPNAVTAITVQAAAGTANPGTGAFIAKDAGNLGAGLYYARGTLANAPAGRLLTVFDVNFLDPTADTASQNLVANMISLP